jgi:hypothetical protein
VNLHPGTHLLFLLGALAASACGNGSSSSGSGAARQPDSAPPTAASPSVTTTSAAPPTLPDEAIQAAINGKQELLVVRVTNLVENASGSRSDRTTYALEILAAPMGSSTGTVQLSHYGTPRLAPNRVYAITTREGNPMWGTKGLRESVEIPAGQEKAAASLHAERARALGGHGAAH